MDDGVVFVEIPAGSRNKYEWDDELGGLTLDRRLFTSMSYPADYGFVEGTLAEDGDPLDALVLVGEPTFPGCRIRVRAVGVFHMADEKGPDEKVLCVPLNDPSWSSIADIHDVPAQLRNEIEHFFQVYKDLEAKKTVVTSGFGNRSDAQAIIAASRERLSARLASVRSRGRERAASARVSRRTRLRPARSRRRTRSAARGPTPRAGCDRRWQRLRRCRARDRSGRAPSASSPAARRSRPGTRS